MTSFNITQNDYIAILGFPLVGKTTVCEYLSTNYNFQHIPLGKLIREDETYKTVIEDFISLGKLVPSKISIEILQKEITKYEDSTILLDGFPRNMENLREWEKCIGNNLKCVILIECNEEMLFERLASREIMECRMDDSKEVLITRLNSFHKETRPVIDYYKDRGILHIINGETTKYYLAQNVLNILKCYI